VDAFDILRSTGKGSWSGKGGASDTNSGEDDVSGSALPASGSGKGSSTASGKGSFGKSSSGKGSTGEGATEAAAVVDTTDKSNKDEGSDDGTKSAKNGPTSTGSGDSESIDLGVTEGSEDDLGVNEADELGVNEAGDVRRYSSLSNDDP